MPKLIIICGLSFAGKSTLAKSVAKQFGFIEVDADEVKTALYGRQSLDADLTPADWERIYAETDRRIIAYLQSGRSVVDASRNFRRAERTHARASVGQHGFKTVTIHIDTPEAVARQRLQANRETGLRRDIADTDFQEIIDAMEPPGEDEQPLIFQHEETPAGWLAKNSDSLR